jgi:hypothetical protein
LENGTNRGVSPKDRASLTSETSIHPDDSVGIQTGRVKLRPFAHDFLVCTALESQGEFGKLYKVSSSIIVRS